MTQVYFHCFNANQVLIDHCGAMVDDLAQARDRAASVVRSLTTARRLEDWRGWILHANDTLGEELFAFRLLWSSANRIKSRPYDPSSTVNNPATRPGLSPDRSFDRWYQPSVADI